MSQKEKQIKTVYLLRHAKAENLDTQKNDHERRLIEKGVRQATRMAKLAESFRFPPEVIFSSSAVRAHETAKIFAEALQLQNKLIVEDIFYSASQQTYLQRIQKMPDEISSLMLVGHNPVLEDLLVSMTSRSPFHTKMPTCALASIHFHVSLWSEIRPATGILRVLLYPKLFNE